MARKFIDYPILWVLRISSSILFKLSTATTKHRYCILFDSFSDIHHLAMCTQPSPFRRTYSKDKALALKFLIVNARLRKRDRRARRDHRVNLCDL